MTDTEKKLTRIGRNREMDTTKEYILMCEKALEIQELWKPETGDYVYSIRNGNHKDHLRIITNSDVVGCRNPYKPEIWNTTPILQRKRTKNIFIPRQDHLQGMVIDNVGCEEWWENKLFTMCYVFMQTHNMAWQSMEQLWLAFVMSERYSKQWNGTEWK